MKKILFAATLAVLLCAAAVAGTNYNVCFNSLDADQDGVMSKGEFLVAFSSGDATVFDVADRDENGSVTHEEWETYRESRGLE